MTARDFISLIFSFVTFTSLVACGSGAPADGPSNKPIDENILDDSRTVAISSYAFPALGATGRIDHATNTIFVRVPYGTDVTRLVPTFTTTGTNVHVGATLQVSGTTSNDFTNAVAYVVTAADGLSATYNVVVATANYVELESDQGDYIGGGLRYAYSQLNAQIGLEVTGRRLTLKITGDEDWWGDFELPDSLGNFQPGTYLNLTRYPFHNPSSGGLNWSGEGRGCNTLTGWLVVDKVSYANGVPAAVDLHFEQHCEGGSAALRGKVHWMADDDTKPSGPITPVPADLWRPVSGSTPDTGNYVYLQSDAGDYIGAGRTYTYTQAVAQIGVTASNGRVSVSINGNESWRGDFQAMVPLASLQVGYYGTLQRYPFHNPVRGGLDWSGEGRGCNMLTGWFAVDNVSYAEGMLNAIDIRFEQHCEGSPAALRGEIHWRAGDMTSPSGPSSIPAGLWEPSPGTTPNDGNYMYLQSDVGDWIGAGGTYLYSASEIAVAAIGGRLSITINGAQTWRGNFQAMNTLSALEPGYYGNLQRYLFHNPTIGGLDWSGEGRGCNTLTGWFAIDSVTYVNNTLSAINLRFEQHCEGGAAALRGKLRWVQ